MAERCPKCGAVRDPVSDKYPRPFEIFDCGSSTAFIGKFWQSATCRVSQLEARVAELECERDELLRALAAIAKGDG